MGFVPPKKILLEALYWLTAPRKYPSVMLSRQTKKSQHQLSHEITMAVWWLVMVCLLMFFIFALWNCNNMWY